MSATLTGAIAATVIAINGSACLLAIGYIYGKEIAAKDDYSTSQKRREMRRRWLARIMITAAATAIAVELLF